MSHYSVAVIMTKEHVDAFGGDIEKAIEPIMAPYQENNMGDCPEEYLEFNETETEHREEFENDSIPMWKLPDGSFVGKYDNSLRNPNWSFGGDDRQYLDPEGAVSVEVPHKERFVDFETYMKDYVGYNGRDEKTGKYGYWENPNAKWDYWRLGGRWLASLPIKQHANSAHNANEIPWELTFGGENNVPDGRYTGTHADACLLADIDWEAADKQTDEKIAKFVNDVNILHSGEKLEDIWVEFNARGNLFEMGIMKDKDDPYPELTIEEINEKYRHHFTFRTYALVDAHDWHEAGPMGWWGCSHADSDNHDSYRREYIDLLKSYDPDHHYIAIVDCHI